MAPPGLPKDESSVQLNMLQRDLILGHICADEYFCMLVSLIDTYGAEEKVGEQIKPLKNTDLQLHKDLADMAANYFTDCVTNQSQTMVTEGQGEVWDESLDIELALAISLDQTKVSGEQEWPKPTTAQKSAWPQSKHCSPSQSKFAMDLDDHESGAVAKNMNGSSYAQVSAWSSKTKSAPSQKTPTSASSQVVERNIAAMKHANVNVGSPNQIAGSSNHSGSGMSNSKPSMDAESDPTISSKKKSKSRKKKTQASLMKNPSSRPVIYWFRRDLRLYDNPALIGAIECNVPVIPVFIWCEQEEGPLAAGGATKLWLHHALDSFSQSLKDNFGSQMIFRKTENSLDEMNKIFRETNAGTLVMNDLYEPIIKTRDDLVCKQLEKRGVECKRYHSYLIYQPGIINTETVGMRGLGSVTHFMACAQRSSPGPMGHPLDAPGILPRPSAWPASMPLAQLGLARMPKRRDGTTIDWGKPIREAWDFSEEAAYRAVGIFFENGIRRYEKESGRSDQLNTSKVSPYLHFGQISPRAIIADAKFMKSPKYLRKFSWRDLSYWLLSLFPELPREPTRPHYRHQRWSRNKGHLKAWQKGKTGFPLVDAAMRELWLTGWQNNYMRHVVASFLISYLHLHWIEGYNWFQDTLVDADVAINAMMWQNGGMSGLDQWNFVMHPVDAALTCDPKGDYVRKWVPELVGMPEEYIHKPWACPPSILRRANVQLGVSYPHRIITDLEEAREQSLRDVTEMRLRHGSGFIDPHTGSDMIPLPNGRLIPCITRREFKYKTSNPDAKDNPHTAVLRGYRSRKRDEAIASAIEKDFLASTMNECVMRQERSAQAAGFLLEDGKKERRRGPRYASSTNWRSIERKTNVTQR